MGVRDFDAIWDAIVSPKNVGGAILNVGTSTLLYPDARSRIIYNMAMSVLPPLTRRCVYPFAERVVSEIKSKFVKTSTEGDKPPQKKSLSEIIHTIVVIGYNPLLTFGGVLTYPFLSSPPVYLATKGTQNTWTYQRIHIASIDPAKYPEHHYTLVVLKTLLFTKNLLRQDLSDILARAAVVVLTSKIYPAESPEYQQFFRKASLLATTLVSAFLSGTILKNHILKHHSPELEGLIKMEQPLQEEEPMQREIDLIPPGDFAPLALELIVLITNKLGRQAGGRLARTSRYFRYVCNVLERDKEYVRGHFPSAIVDAIGENKLASLPIIDTGTKVVDPKKPLSKEDWDNIVVSLRYPESCFSQDNKKQRLEKFAGMQFLNAYCSRPFVDYRVKSLPTVSRANSSFAHPILYAVTPSDMGDHAMVRFVDVLGRQGIAFQIECEFKLTPRLRDPTLRKIRGTTILHQLDPLNKDGIWVWVSNLELSFTESIDDDIFIIYYRPVNSNQDLQWFMFLHQLNGEIGPDCKGNLEWLAKFSSGKR